MVFPEHQTNSCCGGSWHRDLPARLYSRGFLLTHERLSREPKSGSAVWAGGLHRAGLLPEGALSRSVFLGGGVGRTDWLLFGSTCPCFSQQPSNVDAVVLNVIWLRITLSSPVCWGDRWGCDGHHQQQQELDVPWGRELPEHLHLPPSRREYSERSLWMSESTLEYPTARSHAVKAKAPF